MRVSCRDNSDPGIEIEEAVAIYVFDNRPFAALGDQRIAASV
jgi:hypothetical protein